VRNRKQSGCLVKRGQHWLVRYRITVNEDGQLKTRLKAEVVGSSELAKKEARKEADRILMKVNGYRTDARHVVSVSEFVKNVYLPFVKQHKRPSTEKGYRDLWEDHLSSRCGRALLREVRTCDVQRWIETVAAEDKTKKGTLLGRRTLANVKCLLSGIFAHAKRQGYFDGANPVEDTSIPPTRNPDETWAYSTAEIETMLAVLPEPARTLVAVAAFTGVRHGELRGLRWENYKDEELSVQQSVWKGYTTDPKTEKSKAAVPVISKLAPILKAHRLRIGNPTVGLMFPSGGKQPLELNNVIRRTVLPVLNRCATCQKPQGECDKTIAHTYERDASMPDWHGWHAFRRGLATNLHDYGVDDLTIQRILRHSDVSVTRACYIKTMPAQAVEAMNKLDLMFSDCSQTQAASESTTVQ
jgi:integrase